MAGLRLPGDKSISHRAALIAALASGNLQKFQTSQPLVIAPRPLPACAISVSRLKTKRQIIVRGRSETYGHA